jgi:hypothetical protein
VKVNNKDQSGISDWAGETGDAKQWCFDDTHKHATHMRARTYAPPFSSPHELVHAQFSGKRRVVVAVQEVTCTSPKICDGENNSKSARSKNVVL